MDGTALGLRSIGACTYDLQYWMPYLLLKECSYRARS